jgi:FixJ family two-component response regulator
MDRPFTFASAEEFLTSDRMDDTACLISDVQMPGMSGIELQERLNADGHRFSIIFVAASPEASIRGKALAAGALEFLGKPFDDEVLIACLERALARRQPYTTA